jgi:hypothetical protein
MGAVDDSHYSLVIAAAQAAGLCPVGEEAAWGRRVHGLTVDLHLIAQQARQDIERLESARTFIAFLEKVEIEESSRRGLLPCACRPVRASRSAPSSWTRTEARR